MKKSIKILIGMIIIVAIIVGILFATTKGKEKKETKQTNEITTNNTIQDAEGNKNELTNLNLISGQE